MLDIKPKNILYSKSELLSRHQQELEHNKEIHELRKKYIPKIYRLIKRWLLFLGIFLSAYTLVLACVNAILKTSIQILPGYVLVALLGMSTAIVFGLFVIAANWLYPNAKKHKCTYNSPSP